MPPPIALFRFFFTDIILNTIVRNTNIYAESKRTAATATGRAWKSISRDELVTWIAITIYIGLHKLSLCRQLWNTERETPTHYISRYMNQIRYENVLQILSLLNTAIRSSHSCHISATSQNDFIHQHRMSLSTRWWSVFQDGVSTLSVWKTNRLLRASKYFRSVMQDTPTLSFQHQECRQL